MVATIDMSDAIAELDMSAESPVLVSRHTAETIDGLGRPVSTWAEPVALQAPYVLWPSSPKERDLLPIGVRQREAMSIISADLLRGETTLRPDEIVLDDGQRYRVQALANWKRTGNFVVAVCVLVEESEDLNEAP